jgi:hypothetical protein
MSSKNVPVVRKGSCNYIVEYRTESYTVVFLTHLRGSQAAELVFGEVILTKATTGTS